MRRGLVAAMCLIGAGPGMSGLGGQELPDHARFSSVLQTVVTGDRVDYTRLTEDRLALREYLAALGRVSLRSIAAADRDSRLAFWINAYHACLLDLVAVHYPIEQTTDRWPASSIRQIDAVFSRRACHVALADRSLDEMVHQILGPMGDPRVHLALSCAAVGCPALAPGAYEAAEIDGQLEAAVRRFIRDPRHVSLRRGAPTVVRINDLFERFADDFGGESGVRRFLAVYLDEGAAALVLDPETRLEYVDPDWTLNDVGGGGVAR